MYINRYIHTPVMYEKYIGDDNDFKESEYESPVEIFVRKEGKKKFAVGENAVRQYDIFNYLSSKYLTPRSKLDGMTVLTCEPIYNLRGKITHYESEVGEA